MRDNIPQKNINFMAMEPPEALMEKLKAAKIARKRHLIALVVCLLMMFVNILIAVLLTGAKEFNEFGYTDWNIITVMGIIEIATVILCFCFADKSGKAKGRIEKLIFEIRKILIETSPLLPGYMLKVFTDENYSARITVFGYPNEKSVYFTIEGFDPNYTFLKIYESEIFENIDQLSNGFENFVEITENFEIT